MTTSLIKYYERRSVTGKSIIWALMCTVIGSGLGLVIHLFYLQWLEALLLRNFFEGLVIGYIAYLILAERNETLKRRFKEIGDLNHHVRNALQSILFAVHEEDLKKRIGIVIAASNRIQWCLRKMTRGEDIGDTTGERQEWKRPDQP